MHRVVGEVAEERVLVANVLANEGFCPIGKELGCVPFGDAIGLSVVHQLGSFLGNPIGMGPTEKPAKLIESTIVRNFSVQ